MSKASGQNRLSFVCLGCHLNAFPYSDGILDDGEIENTSYPLLNNISFDFAKLDIKSIKCLKIGHLNINGLRSKLDFLKLFLHTNRFDIFSLNETKVDKNVLDSELNIPIYNLFRRNRNKHYGGVII